MSLFFGATEITKLRDLAPQSDLGITDLWFGSTNVYTVWGTYEGTLPATFNANGDNMKQYQIYGAEGGVGDDSGTAYGYEVPINVKSGNIVPKFTNQSQENLTLTVQNDGSIKINGSDSRNAFFYMTLSLSEGTYSMNNFISIEDAGTSTLRVDIRRGAKDGTIVANGKAIDNGLGKTFSVSSEYAGLLYYVIRVAANYQANNVTISPCMVNGNAIPTKYQPYYTTTTPIYIGDEPLDKDEYVDYVEQKIYRMSGGVLTPTDPPVALPALPTCDGTTIVDYAGQSVATPEKVLFEYRKEGF